MQFYSLHHRPGAGPEEARIVAVSSGFSWAAALFTPFWLAWHRHWLALLAYVVFMALLSLLLDGVAIADPADFLVGGALAFLFGASAADLRRWLLARAGLPMQAIRRAASVAEAERLWRQHLALQPSYSQGRSPAAVSGAPLAGAAIAPFPRLV